MTRDRTPTLQEAVRELRANAGLSQPEMAAALGYDDPGRIHRFERFGPTVDSFPRYAEFALDHDDLVLALRFLDAYYSEYPALKRVMDRLTCEISGSKAGKSGVYDKDTAKIHAEVDRILESASERAISTLQAGIKIALIQAKEGG